MSIADHAKAVGWWRKARAAGRGVLDLIYPPECLLCGAGLHEAERDFCAVCAEELSAADGPTCRRCAATVGPYADVQERCPLCREESYAFERCVRLGAYDGLRRQAVLRMKRSRDDALAEALRGKRILLIDDVMTTGSTATAAARALLSAGAASVVVAVLARAQG